MIPAIMLVTYNRLNLTKKTFETTLLNTGIKYHLIVVDNNSADDTIEYLKSFECDLLLSKTIVKLKENKGIAYGRNLGLFMSNQLDGDCVCTLDNHIECDYLCTLDNDVICEKDWLLNCCSVLESNKNIGACGVNFEIAEFPKANVKTNIGNIQIKIKPRGNLGTACMVFRRVTHDKIGYFEPYEKYGHEDALFGYKIRKLGYNLCYLGNDGIHLGVEQEDSGQYREMKDKYWKINMEKFQVDIRDVANGIRQLRTEFEYNKDDIEYFC